MAICDSKLVNHNKIRCKKVKFEIYNNKISLGKYWSQEGTISPLPNIIENNNGCRTPAINYGPGHALLGLHVFLGSSPAAQVTGEARMGVQFKNGLQSSGSPY